MTDSVPVRKTKYRAKKIPGRAKDKFQAPRRSVTDFPKQARRAREARNIGDTVQLKRSVEVFGSFPVAIPGDYGRYGGEINIPLVGERCVIKLARGTAYLPDDGLHFEWVD